MTDPSLHPLDRATRLDGDPASRRRVGTIDESYWTFIGPFGGTTAATLLRAVLEDPDRDGDPIAVTVNYCAPLAQGPFDVAVRLARKNRSSQHWIVEATQGGGDAVVATATVVTAVRRESWSHAAAAPPSLPDPETMRPLHRPDSLAWVQRYAMRFAEGLVEPVGEGGDPGAMHDPPRSPRSVLWLADAPPRPLDFVSLTAMSDAFFGRLFQVIGRFPPFGTVTLTTHFHASAAELAEQGAEPLACVADARVFHRSYADQVGELWSRRGRLLATTTQMAYFKV